MPSTSTFEEKPSLDETVLRQLMCDLGEDNPGAESTFALLVADYRCESRLYLAEIKAAVAGADAPRLRQAAHTLKSTSATFGALRLSAISRVLEEMGRSGSTMYASGLVQDAEGELSRVLRLLPFPE